MVVEYFIEHTTFKCTVLEERIEAPDVKILQHKAFDRLEHWMKMEWFAVIDVTCAEDIGRYFSSGDAQEDEDEAQITIKARRFWLSRSPAGRVVQCEYDVEPEHRKAKLEKYGGTDIQLTRLPLGAPFKFKGEDAECKNGGRWLIDYDDTIWETIQQMIEAIKNMRRNLIGMFKSKDGIVRLQAAGAKLLAFSSETAAPKQIGPAKKGHK